MGESTAAVGATGRERLAWALLCCLAVATPFAVVHLPPLTDLAQHAAQVRLAFETVGSSGSPYRIQWLTPYSLGYLPMVLGWTVLPPMAAARCGALLLVLAWVGGVHLLAARWKRPVESAVLASALVFHNSLYWGFLSFFAGWIAFVLWLVLLESGRGSPLRQALCSLAGSCALYATHALWFALGMLWLAIASWRDRRRGLAWWPHALGAVPAVLVAAVWFRGLSDTPFATPPLWAPLGQRIGPDAWVAGVFGGLRGPLEGVLVLLLALWLVAGIRGGWGRLRQEVHGTALRLGLLLLALFLVLPDKYTNTILFDDRWLPYAVVCLLLAVPPPRLRRAIARAFAAAFLAGLVAATAAAWIRVERTEMSGFDAALSALPEQPRTLGLDFDRVSSVLRGTPFLQDFAWAQVVHGGELNFSFADFPPMPVVYRTPRRPPWTVGLEWLPWRLQRADIGYFDVVMVHAGEEVQARFAADPGLRVLAAEGRWHLYRVEEVGESGAPGSPALD